MLSLEGKRILLVEDEPVIALDHACQLSDAGAEIVGPFPSVMDALSELDHTEVDVAVIDYVLRDQTSVPLQEELTRRDVPFIVVTAYPKVLVRRNVGQHILSKPVNTSTLCELVLRVSAARISRREAGLT